MGLFREIGGWKAGETPVVRGNWVRFAYLGLGKPARRQRYEGIGFVSHIWAWESREDGGGAGIGFVSHNRGVGGAEEYVRWGNWVFFAHSGCGRLEGDRGRAETWDMRNWVRFVYLGRWDGGGGVNWVRFAEIVGGGTLGMLELGSFRFFGVGQGNRGGKLGSFCIIGAEVE